MEKPFLQSMHCMEYGKLGIMNFVLVLYFCQESKGVAGGRGEILSPRIPPTAYARTRTAYVHVYHAIRPRGRGRYSIKVKGTGLSG